MSTVGSYGVPGSGFVLGLLWPLAVEGNLEALEWGRRAAHDLPRLLKVFKDNRRRGPRVTSALSKFDQGGGNLEALDWGRRAAHDLPQLSAFP